MAHANLSTLLRAGAALQRCAALLALSASPLAAQSIVDPGFENNPVGGYVAVHTAFITSAATGDWGVESGVVVVAENGVTPRESQMLRMNAAGGFASQGWQAVDLSAHPMAADIASGAATLEFSALANAPASVGAASFNLQLHFWSDNGSGLPQLISSAAGGGLIVDANPSSWQSAYVRATAPVGTRWVLTEVLYSNGSLAGQFAYVDDTNLDVLCGSCTRATGGPIPTAGTGNGSFPTTLPSAPLMVPINVTPAAGATVLSSVRLNGLTHTWAGDLQFVLADPSGNQHNLQFRPGYTGSGNGCSGNYGGDYRLVDVASGIDITCTSQIAEGDYRQNFGVWPNGNLGIFNTPMCNIPVAAGTWTLIVYDWAGGDVGSLGSVELCFDGDVETIVVRTGQSGGEPGVTFQDDDSFFIAQSSAGCNTALNPLNLGAVGANPARVVTPHPAWNPRLALDPYARWIHSDAALTTGYGAAARSVLYSVQFDVATQGDPLAKLDAEWICDDFLGAAGVTGLYLNGSPLGMEFTGHSGALSYAPLVRLNTGVNTLHVYQRDGGCSVAGLLMSLRFQVTPCSADPAGPYCTAGTSTAGCQALMSSTGIGSASMSAPHLMVRADNVEGQRVGLIFYALEPKDPATPWASGSTSFLCIKAPTQRTPAHNSGGTVGACDGVYQVNWAQYQLMHPGALGQPWSVGDHVYFQAWYRDPPAPKTTNLSNALEVVLGP